MPSDLDPEGSCSMTWSPGSRQRVSRGRTWISPLSRGFRLIAVVLPAVAAVVWSCSQGPLSTSPGRVTLIGHTRLVEAATFSPDGRTLASWGFDHTVRLWDAARLDDEYPPELEILDHPSVVFAAAFSPDGARLVAAGDRTLTIWSGGPSYRREVERSGETYHGLAFSPDGRTLALGAEDGTIRLWEMPAARERMALRGHSGEVRSAAFSPDGDLLASAGQDGRVVLWDARRWIERRVLIKRGAVPVRGVAFSPDGRTLAVAEPSFDARDVVLFDAETGAVRTRLKGHPLGINALAFSVGGRTLATAGVDHRVRLWDLATTKEVGTVKADPWVKSVAFSPDGRWLAHAGGDETVRLLDLTGRKSGRAGNTRTVGRDDRKRT